MGKIINKCFISALLSAIMFTLISCDKYLNVSPKGVQLLTTVTDYDQWLNARDLEISIAREINYLADNIDNPNITNPQISSIDRAYTWQSQLSEDVNDMPYIWSYHYKCIYCYNTVLEGIDDAVGSDQEKKSLKAEALLGRAFEYLYLVNLYGKQYNSSTANEDLAIPFVTSNDLMSSIPDRSTVQQIYDHIITDITAAISGLPQDNNNNRFRGSVSAAYGVLARTYLYMGKFVKAAENANLALDNGPNEVLDYSTMTDSRDIPNLPTRPDAIYARLSVSYLVRETPALTFLRSFDQTDLRLQFYYKNLQDYSFTTRGQVQYWSYGAKIGNAHANWGISVAEMRLIIAEAAARANDLPEAIRQLDLVRKCRFKAADYFKYDPANPVQEEVLQKVLQERTLEFPFCGMRWFDMRRLDAEGRMPEVNRYDGSGNVIATLPAHSNKYTLQIPLQVMYFHSDWPQNSWDE